MKSPHNKPNLLQPQMWKTRWSWTMHIHIPTSSYATKLVTCKFMSTQMPPTLSFPKPAGAGHFYLRSHTPPSVSLPQPPTNGPILTECVTLHNIMTSAAEAETGSLHHNGLAAIPICVTLHELHHLQGPTYFKRDNDKEKGFLPSTIYKKLSKAWDCKYHWMKEKSQKMFF